MEPMNDIEIAATGTRLPIRETYHVIENVQVTLQDDGGQAISVKVMDKDPKRGPLSPVWMPKATGSKVLWMPPARVLA